MLAANNRTQELLDGSGGATIEESANFQSSESIRRFCDRKSREYAPAGCRVEYDGQIIRCISLDNHSWKERVVQFEEKATKIDPMCQGESAWMQNQISGNVVWWHDLLSLRSRYRAVKTKVDNAASLSGVDRQGLKNVPVVLGGDWEFNAWACPAGEYGDFIMVNWGFMHSYTYAAMFIEALDEARQASEAGEARGIVASSMIWMAASALGYEALQYDNLSLPHSERDRIWQSVQRPSGRLAHAIAVIDAFTMLHECGHIAKGHLKARRNWQLDEILTAKDRAERHEQMRAFEFEADAFACDILRSVDRDGRAYVEPLLILFSMMRLCEGRSSPSLVSTHPAAAARFRACLEALGQDAEAKCQFLEMLVEFVVDTSKRRLEWQATQHRVEPRDTAT